MGYEEAINYLNDTAGFAKKTSLNNIRCFLKELGSPEKELSMIHVAGTNGKGSTCIFMDRLLREKGKSVGVFTSPHIVVVNERIKINGQIVNNEQFTKAFEKVHHVIKNQRNLDHPSFFEFLFLMALILFKEYRLDICIIETGMGGRYDATNVISPKVSIITSISLDHIEFLGKTYKEIAIHKAGIIKKHVPVICAPQHADVKKEIYREAKEKNSKVVNYSEDNLKFQTKLGKLIDFSYTNAYDSNKNVSKNIFGEFQTENLMLAVLALRSLGEEVKEDEIVKCLQNIQLPGRMEEIAPGIFVDVAHNIQGIEGFIHTVEKKFLKKKRILFATSHKVEEEAMIARIKNIHGLEKIYYVTINGREVMIQDFKHTLKQMITDKDDQTVCFVVGSFYLVGETKRYIQEEY